MKFTDLKEVTIRTNEADVITFKKGQKVRNRYGQVLTVLRQDGLIVYIEEDLGTWYHPRNLFPVDE